MTADGNVTTLAGNPVVGFVNGIGTNAQFREPSGIAVESNSNV
jgi:hypothetical protein